MRRKEWMRVVAALAAFAVLGTGSAVTAAAEETGTVVSETDSTADKTVFTGSCGEDATWTYDKSSETLTIMGTGSVEAYVKAGVMIKTPGWQVVNDYAAKHIVIGDGITEVGEGFLDTCIYGTTEPRTLQVSSTVTKMDLNPALQERSVTFYGTKGSWFYEQVYETNRFVDISTGEPDKVPTSGTYSDGASWNYDEKSETLTVSGDGGITEKEFTTYFGWDRPVKRIVIGKEVKLPDWNSDVSGLNLFFRALISDAETGNGPFLSIYPDSEAGKAYEDLVAYRVSKGSTEEEVRSGLEEVVAFLDANIAYTGACGAEGSEITWSLDPNTNTLTFSGTGTIRTYDGPNAKFENPAWNDCNVSINHIVVGEGITDIIPGVRDPHLLQIGDGGLIGLLPAHTQVQPQPLRHLTANGQQRIEGSHGLLEDHPHLLPPEGIALLGRERGELLSVELDAPGHHPAIVGKKVHDGQRGDALAAAGLAHHA